MVMNMRNAVIDAYGVVINIIEGAVPGLTLVPDDGTARIGGSWNGSRFISPVPEVISPRQFRQSLTHYGFRTNVENAISAATTSQDTKDWYQYATQFERHHPQVLSMATSLGYTSAQLDQVWTYGAAL